MTDFSQALGARIREARTELQLTQHALGVRAGIHPSRISDYERGAVSPQGAALVALANALGVTTDALLRGPQAPAEPAERAAGEE